MHSSKKVNHKELFTQNGSKLFNKNQTIIAVNKFKFLNEIRNE